MDHAGPSDLRLALAATGVEPGEEGFCLERRDGVTTMVAHPAAGLLYGLFHVVRLGEAASASTGPDPAIRRALHAVMNDSRRTYERYTAPLGVGFMVRPGHHYGPEIDGYEYTPWGTYHFADRDGVGVDRTVATGSGFTAQYPKPWSDVYESLEQGPDKMLLFFHHVPYDHLLHNRSTVVQHIYDTHFAGVEQVCAAREAWRRLAGTGAVQDAGLCSRVRKLLDEQVRSAEEWRDQVNTYFFRKSGVPDARGRRIHRPTSPANPPGEDPHAAVRPAARPTRAVRARGIRARRLRRLPAGRERWSAESWIRQPYYRRLITDAARAVEAVRELPGVDAERVAVPGNSQGGGSALALTRRAQAPAHFAAGLARHPVPAEHGLRGLQPVRRGLRRPQRRGRTGAGKTMEPGHMERPGRQPERAMRVYPFQRP